MSFVAVFVDWVAAQDILPTRTLNFAVTFRLSPVPAKMATCNHCIMLASKGVAVSCCPVQLPSATDMLHATRTGQQQLETLAKQSNKVMQRSWTGCFDASACSMVLCICVFDVLQSRAWLAHKPGPSVLPSISCGSAGACLLVYCLCELARVPFDSSC